MPRMLKEAAWPLAPRNMVKFGTIVWILSIRVVPVTSSCSALKAVIETGVSSISSARLRAYTTISSIDGLRFLFSPAPSCAAAPLGPALVATTRRRIDLFQSFPIAPLPLFPRVNRLCYEKPPVD